MSQAGPSLDEVVAFVRDYTRTRRQLSAGTRLEADVGVTGDDGVALLEAAEEHFGRAISDPETGVRETFGLGPNEYLFGSEGLDLIGISALVRWLRGRPRPTIRDLTIAELYEALARAPPLASRAR